MEDASAAKPGGKVPNRRHRGKITRRVSVEDQIVKAEAPLGSRFKGYEDFAVQELELRVRAIRYRRERWLTPEGRTVIAPLPPGVEGHFGPELRRFVLMQYHQGQVTVPRLVSVDDTGARHKGVNGFCTQIGNDSFAWFGTTQSKSRLNFLNLLRAGYTDYVVNDAALRYMRERALAGPIIVRLAEHPDRQFADPQAWQAHLERLGITELSVTPNPVQIATEGALWGSIQSHEFLPDAVIVSDDAGQFAVGQHALCWIHAERLVHKLDTFTDDQRAAQQHVRSLIWQFYADLKDYCRAPTPWRRAHLSERFDYIFLRHTGFATLDRLLQRLQANKAELLTVLDHPDIPLNTNDSETDIRSQVTRRKVSGGTRSDLGRDCRDAFLGLAKTCTKQGIAFWNYLGSRLFVPDQPVVPALSELIRCRGQPA